MGGESAQIVMMMANEFTVEIPSNSSMTLFPDNKIGEFTAHFPIPIEVKNEYEVGLSGIHYTQSWNNVREGENSFDFAYIYRNGKRFAATHKITPGYYPNVQNVIDAIIVAYKDTHRRNHPRNRIVSGLKIELNTTTRKVTISTDEMTVRIRRGDRVGEWTNIKAQMRLNGDVARILGFSDARLIEGKDVEGAFSATPNAGFHQMYIYTDIIQPQIGPDGQYPLLRVTAMDTNPIHQLNVEKSFNPVYYKPIKKHTIDTAQFWLLDDSGKRLDFQHGKVVIALTFRKKL